jgi:hypothetical protein
MKSIDKQRKWIIPLGLERTVQDFGFVCDILSNAPRKTPLMVMGDILPFGDEGDLVA